MKRVMLTGLFLIFSVIGAFAQTAEDKAEEPAPNLVTHRVEQGETVMLLCKKYLITPTDIYKYNPDAVEGISYNMVLQIPVDKKLALKPKQKTNSVATSSKSLTQGALGKNR
jgi:LysM repeat protein